MLVVIACPEGEYCAGGKFVEAGYAFGNGVDVWHLGRCENGMMQLAYDGGETAEEFIQEMAALTTKK